MGIILNFLVALFCQLILTSSGTITAQICPYPDGIYVVQEDCTSFLRCEGGNSRIVPCPRNLSFNPHKLTCDYNTEDNCITKTESDVHAGGSPTTDEHICPDKGSSIQPSSNSCAEYHRCVNGTAYKESCPDGLLMNKHTLTCDFADEVPCDVFRQRKLLQDDDTYDYDSGVDNPQEVTVSSVSDGVEPNGVPEGGDSVNAAGSEEETLDILKKDAVDEDKNEDVSDNPENTDSINRGENEDVSFTDILLPTATSLKNTFETTTDALSLTTKMQSAKTELSDKKAVESDVNTLSPAVNTDKSNSPSLQSEKYPESSTLSHDKTFQYSPNPSPTSGTTVAIQAESNVTDSLFSQKELYHSSTVESNINDQTNKSTTENNIFSDNLVTENKFVSTEKDASESSLITSVELKTETSTNPPNNTGDASELVQTTNTNENILTSTPAYTVQVPTDKASNSLNANDESYDIVSDAETTSETLTQRATNTTITPLSNATSESVSYSTAKPTTVTSTTFNNTNKPLTTSDTYKVNITTESSADSTSNASSLDYVSKMTKLSSNATEQNIIRNEYVSNSNVSQNTTMVLTIFSSETTDSLVETSSIKNENSSEEFSPEKSSNESIDSKDINKTLIAFTTESSQQTTIEYKNTTILDDLPVSSTTLTTVSESLYEKLENEGSSQNAATDKNPTTKSTTGPPLSMTPTDQLFNDVITAVSPTKSDKLNVSVVTPVIVDTELTEFTTSNKDEKSTTTTTTTELQEKRTDSTKVTESYSIQNNVKAELSSTTIEGQLRSEVTVATDTQTTSFKTNMITEQTTDVETTIISKNTNSMETTTNKYQNDDVQTTLSEMKRDEEPTEAKIGTDNLIVNVTDKQTSYEFKSDIPTTPMSEQKDNVTTSAIDDMRNTMETVKSYEQTTRTQNTMPDDQVNTTEIATFDTQMTNEMTTMPELKSVKTTPTESQGSNPKTVDDIKQISNVDEFTVNELTSDVQTTPLREQNNNSVTMLIDEQMKYVKTTPTYDPTTDKLLSSVDATSNGEKYSDVPTSKTMEYFSTVVTTINDEQTMGANSTTTEQGVYNVETTGTEKRYNDVGTASTKDLTRSTLNTGIYISESSSDVMTTRKLENNMEISSVEVVPLNVSEDQINITETTSVKEHTGKFQTATTEFLSDNDVATIEKDTSSMATMKTNEHLIPVEKTTEDTKQKISSTETIETTVGKISTGSYTATEKSQTTDETITDDQKEEIPSSVSTIMIDKELSTMDITGNEKELMNMPSTTENEIIKSTIKDMLTTLPTRHEDMSDITTVTSMEKSGSIGTLETRDYLQNVITAITFKAGITGTEYEIENETAVPTEIQQMSSSRTTEGNLNSSSMSTINKQLDDITTATIDKDRLGTFTTTDKLTYVTTPPVTLFPVVTTEKYVSSMNTEVDEKYTTKVEYTLKPAKLAINIESSTSAKTVTPKELNSESTTETDEVQNSIGMTTNKEYLSYTVTSANEKNLDIVTGETEKPSISTDCYPTNEYNSNKDALMTKNNFITVDTTKAERIFTDSNDFTTEQSPLTVVKESSSLKTTEFYRNPSTIKTIIQNYSSSMDSTMVELHSNNISSSTRDYESTTPLITTADQISSLSETTHAAELSSKTVANTEQSSNTENISDSFSPYTITTEKELRIVTDARSEETSFSATEEDPRGMENVKTVEYHEDYTTVYTTREKYPGSTDSITTGENITDIDTITTEEYSSRLDTIPTEKYPNSIEPITTKRIPSTVETITSSNSIDDSNTDNYHKSIVTITTEKDADTNTITNEEYTSRINTIPTEKYPSTINPITTETYLSTTESLSSSSNIDNTNTGEYPRNTETITTEGYVSMNYISTQKSPNSFYYVTTEKYSSNLEAITTDEYPNRSVSTEMHTTTIDSNSPAKYVSSLTTITERNNNNQISSETEPYSSGTFTAIMSDDPNSAKTTVEDKELKDSSITTADKYPSIVNLTTTEEHLSNMSSFTTTHAGSNVDVTTDTYSSSITASGTVNYNSSSVTVTNMESAFTGPSSTARVIINDESSNDMTTLTEEDLKIIVTAPTAEQPIGINTITTAKYPLSVYASTQEQLSTGTETILEEDLISAVNTNTQEMFSNTTFATDLSNSLSLSTEQLQNKSETTLTEDKFEEVSTAFEPTSITESTLTSVSPRGSRIENSTNLDYSFSNKMQTVEISPTTQSVLPDDQNANYCNDGDGIFPHKNNCSMFIRCFSGSPYFLSCPEGLYYNATKRTCDFNGECGSEPRVPSSRNLQLNCECENCLYPDAGDCTKYYLCLNGSAYDMQCNDGLQFNPETLSCDYEGTVTCAKSSEECSTPNGYVKGSDNCSRYFHCVGGFAYRKTCEDGQHFNEVTKQCEDPCSAGCDSYACMKASTLLPSPVCQDGDKFYPHPENCNAFYTCSNGRAELAFCIDDEHFSPTARMCQEPCQAMCDRSLECFKTTGVTESVKIDTTQKDKSNYGESTTSLPYTSPIILTTEHETTVETSTRELSPTNDARTNAISFTSEVDSTETTIGITNSISSEYPGTYTTELTSFEPTTISSICNTSDGFFPKPGDCSSFIQCTSGIPTEHKCGRPLHFSPRTLKCEYPCYAECDPTLDCSTTESPDLPTHQPFNLCPKRDILPGKKCEQYIYCTGDQPFPRRCPVGLHFNPTTRVCDWPRTAGCGKPSSYPDVDNYFKCPCETCIIPSVENCTKYHLCIEHVAYATKCSEGLLFDTILNTCNRASKVKCEEVTTQPITTPTPSFTVSTTEKATTTAETYKCPTKEGYFRKSDDCGKFIQCANYRPYVLKCPSNLHFSMKTLRCEYPCDANCDLNLACSNTSKSGTADKICVCLNCKVKDPESCTNYFECKNGKSRRLFCRRGQTFDSERGACDWAHKVKCHSQTCPKMNGLFPHRDNCRKFLHCANGIPYINECHNNWEFDPVTSRCSWPTGRCGSTTSSPSTIKPQTKSLKDFECPKNFGIFRDEQNCTRFYHCSHSIPFAKECPGGLAFNPKSQTCDWKNNVKCDSNRQYYQRRCRVYDRHATCPQSRINIPHSNCDMFFDCSSGSACGKRCPVGLYFNSTTAVCDRPENVQCYKGKNEVYSLREFARTCYKTGEGYMIDPAMSHCFYRCHHERVIRACCPRNAVYNEKKDKCEIQHRRLFF